MENCIYIETTASLGASSPKSGAFVPLVDPKKQVRILDLRGGRHGDRLRGRLRAVSLSDSPRYEALSYTWGAESTEETHDTPDAVAFKITPNLSRALRRLRQRDKVRTLWVDAICINQNDDVEKGDQVWIMGEVYSAASAVLIWLGDCASASSLDQWKMRRPHIKSNGQSLVQTRSGRKFVRGMNEAIASSEPKWHDRAWVIQEYTLAKQAIVCFGSVSFPLDLRDITDLISSSQELLPGLVQFHTRLRNALKLKPSLDGARQHLAEAALRTVAASCRDPWDRIYCLLSLIDKDEALLIGANYRRDTAWTFTMATFATMISRQDFSILEFVFNSDVDGLPSWAVDFPLAQDSIGRLMEVQSWKSVRWTKGRKHTTFRRPIFDRQTKSLTVKGCRLDRVAETMSLLGPISFRAGGDRALALAAFLARVWHVGPNSSVPASRLLRSGNDSTIYSVMNAAFSIWDSAAQLGPSRQNRGLDDDCGMSLRAYLEYATAAIEDTVFFVTDLGFLGIGRAGVQVGDIVYLVPGSEMPVILRKTGDAYRFLGLAYAHGVTTPEFASNPEEEIRLV